MTVDRRQFVAGAGHKEQHDSIAVDPAAKSWEAFWKPGPA